jgi:hypothetical protein
MTLTVALWLGRLELMTVLVLLSPEVWRAASAGARIPHPRPMPASEDAVVDMSSK